MKHLNEDQVLVIEKEFWLIKILYYFKNLLMLLCQCISLFKTEVLNLCVAMSSLVMSPLSCEVSKTSMCLTD